MKYFVPFALLASALAFSTTAHAVCGDVTGDTNVNTTDALAVLRSAVGQSVNLVCIDDTPSRIAFYNDIDCNSGSDTSQLRFSDSDENYTYNANPGVTTSYQTVDDSQIEDVEIDLCGDTYTFGDPFNLAPGRSYTLFMVLIDPEIYGEGFAYAILYDDGVPVPSSAAALDASGSEPQYVIGSRN